MPYEPTYDKGPDGMPMGYKVPIRVVDDKHEEEFFNAIKMKLKWLERPKPGEERENMRFLLDVIGDDKDRFLLCVSMRLSGTYSTHSYQFIHRNFDGYPIEDVDQLE
jgi:hypothetical protein